jgi:hypothetical protein
MYKSKHICNNNLVIDSWSVNDYQVKTGTYAEDAALRVTGSNTHIYRPLRLRKAIMSDNVHSPKRGDPIVSR